MFRFRRRHQRTNLHNYTVLKGALSMLEKCQSFSCRSAFPNCPLAEQWLLQAQGSKAFGNGRAEGASCRDALAISRSRPMSLKEPKLGVFCYRNSYVHFRCTIEGSYFDRGKIHRAMNKVVTTLFEQYAPERRSNWTPGLRTTQLSRSHRCTARSRSIDNNRVTFG